MAGLFYVGLIHRNSDGFGLVFPDLPGCVTVGKTLDQLAHRARDALSLHLSTMVDDGDNLPSATPLDHITTDPEYPEIGRILVEGRIANRALRVNITLQESLLTDIDKAAEQRGISRSGFLAEAARHMLGAN